ncbi:MAG: hypothetical protein IMZ64_05275, partial [Bacteroidetes bacterium]|nr:hypothetical protein [Bacteroidota bacterium]
TKDGLQKIRATSALLKNFKTRGGQDYNVIDVSPVDKERDYLTKTKDIKNFILQADNVTLGTIAPASKTDGTYSFTVTATKDLGTDKGVEIKNFKVSANEFSGPEAGSWKAAIYDDLMDQGHQAEAYRIVDSRLETEIIAKQNDKEIVIAPDRSNADVKFRFANNLDGTYDQVNTKTGEVIPSNAGLELQEIIQLLYDYKVALLKK